MDGRDSHVADVLEWTKNRGEDSDQRGFATETMCVSRWRRRPKTRDTVEYVADSAVPILEVYRDMFVFVAMRNLVGTTSSQKRTHGRTLGEL